MRAAFFKCFPSDLFFCSFVMASSTSVKSSQGIQTILTWTNFLEASWPLRFIMSAAEYSFMLRRKPFHPLSIWVAHYFLSAERRRLKFKSFGSTIESRIAWGRQFQFFMSPNAIRCKRPHFSKSLHSMCARGLCTPTNPLMIFTCLLFHHAPGFGLSPFVLPKTKLEKVESTGWKVIFTIMDFASRLQNCSRSLSFELSLLLNRTRLFHYIHI